MTHLAISNTAATPSTRGTQAARPCMSGTHQVHGWKAVRWGAGSRRPSGLTLVELLIAMAIVAILGTLAAPPIRDAIIRTKSDRLAGEFVSALQRTRNEAVAKNMCAVICTSNLGTTLSCNSNTDWGRGWIAFRNPTCDETLSTPAAGDVFLAFGPFDEDYSVKKTETTNFDKLIFSAVGTPRAGDRGEFNLQFKSESRISNRAICLSAAGQTRVVDFEGC